MLSYEWKEFILHAVQLTCHIFQLLQFDFDANYYTQVYHISFSTNTTSISSTVANAPTDSSNIGIVNISRIESDDCLDNQTKCKYKILIEKNKITK